MKHRPQRPSVDRAEISMHRIRGAYAGVGDGTAAFLAAFGAILVCLVGLPSARWFLVATIVAAPIAVLAVRAWYQRKEGEFKRLSIK